MKKIPYGIDDFERIILQDYYYIDKTRYIKTVEDQNSYILFVRPRRMGKSLFTNMMMAYYDISKAEAFDSLFGNLWIGSHPTAGANSYLVLKLDFSKVNYDLGALEQNFNSYCIREIAHFLNKYDNFFSTADKQLILESPSAKDAINALVSVSNHHNLHLYLFIDEYDNFTNIVLASKGVDAHTQITHGEGFYRNFFKSLKGSFDRIFMTGVTPVTYDDLTSGFNIIDVVSLLPQFNQIIGVTETELREMIHYYQGKKVIARATDEIVAEMKPWYDNFCFSEECYGVEPPIYNTDMVIRYINSLITSGSAPREMLDHNARTDYDKLNYLVMAEDIGNRERRIDAVKDICAHGFITGNVHEQFPASACGSEANFKSMLYYFGTLTFGGWSEEGDTILQVPNKTMGELYLQYMLKIADQEGFDYEARREALEKSIGAAAIRGEWEQMVHEIGSVYSSYSSLRNSIRGEADIQGFLRGLLCLNKYYDIWPELELGKGYSDILLVPRNTPRCPTKFSYLIEIKYLKAGDNNTDRVVAEACRQLDTYASDAHLSSTHLLRDTPLSKLYLIFQGQSLLASALHP